MGLRLYTVHLPPPSSDDTMPVLIKEGFSWGAFLFSVIWTLWHKLWIETAALLALSLALGVISDFIALSDSIETAILLAVAVLIGFGGNDWRRESFRRRGYRDAGVVSGPDPENALRRFLDLRAVDDQRPAPAPTVYQDPAALFPAPLPPAAPPGSQGGSIAGWYASGHQPAAQSASGTGFGFSDNGPRGPQKYGPRG